MISCLEKRIKREKVLVKIKLSPFVLSVPRTYLTVSGSQKYGQKQRNKGERHDEGSRLIHC